MMPPMAAVMLVTKTPHRRARGVSRMMVCEER
jgi:hypothetical protein